MENLIRALLALIVTSCVAFAAAQPIPDPTVQSGAAVDNLDGQQIPPPVQGGTGDLEDRSAASKEARIQELGATLRQAEKVLATETRPSLRGQAIVASCDAKKEISRLRQQLAALGRRQSATEGKVTKLDGRVGKLEKSDTAQNDLLLGKEGKDRKRSGGMVKFSNDATAALAGDDKLFGTADDVVTGVANDLEETNNGLYGYTDKNRKYHPGVYEVVMGKEGKGGLARGFAELKDQITGVASANAVWLLGIIFVVGFLFLAWKLAGLASWRRGINNSVNEISQDLYGTGGPLAHLSAATPTPVPPVVPPVVPPAPAPVPVPAPVPTPAPAAGLDPVINSMSINTGTTGDAFVLDGVFDGTESVVFIDDISMTAYPATATVTTTQIVGIIPDAGGIIGSFSMVVTNAAGRSATPVAFRMN